MKDSSLYKKIFIYILSLLFVFVITFIYSYVKDDPVFTPRPQLILKDFFNLLITFSTYKIIWHSVYSLLEAILISLFFGMILGLFAGFFTNFYIFLKPIMSFLRTVPVVAVIVLIAGISGIERAPIVLAVLMATPIIYEAFYKGVRTIPVELNEVWRLDSKMSLKVLTNVHLPLIKPFILMSITQSIGLGFKVLIITEFLVGINNTIGRQIVINRNYFNYSALMAWTILAVVLVAIMEFLTKLIAKINISRNDMKKK